MKTLVLAEHRAGKLAIETARTIMAARQLGGATDVLVAGHECSDVADQAARIEGVGKILLADDPVLRGNRAEIMQALIAPLLDQYQAFLAPATSCGKNIAPRLAAFLDVMQVSDIIAIGNGCFRRPIYAGNLIQTIRIPDPVIIATIRTAAFAPSAEAAKAAPIETIPCPGNQNRCKYVGEEINASSRPDLASARCVIAGGRGLGSEQSFAEYIHPLADALEAAIGASRAAVDAGYAPNDYQIGQTGRIVAPELYFAIGISGAIQHLAGIKDAKIVVAINSDAEAPIFKFADYGLVGDLFTIMPQLKDAVLSRQ